MLSTQKENKEIVYNVLIILVYLTEPLKIDVIKEFQYKEELNRYYEGYKNIFVKEDFLDLIVDELKECVKK